MKTSAPVAPQITASDVSFIVPVGGAAPAWSGSAQSLARLDPSPGEIIAVIDGPHDELAQTAADIGARVVLMEEPGGPAKARNRGALVAKGCILFFTDSDVEVPKNLAAQIAELFTAGGEPTAIIGSYDDTPGHPSFLSQYRNLLHHFVHQNGREMASTFWSGCGAVHRSVFHEVGGFDESYPDPSIEDIEFGARLLRAGHTIRLAKDLQVKHLKRWRLVGMLKTDLWHRAVPWTELMLREKHLVNDLNVKTSDRLCVVLALLLPLTLLAAWFWPPILAASTLSLFLLAGLNRRLLRFFQRQRGTFFALSVLPMVWVYFVICGVGFGLGLLRHLSGR